MFSPILNNIVPHESRIYGLASTFSMYSRNNLSFFLYKFLEKCKRRFIFQSRNLQIEDAIIQGILKLADKLVAEGTSREGDNDDI